MQRHQVREFASLLAIEVGGINLQLKQVITENVADNHEQYKSFPEVHLDWMKRYNAMQR